VGWRTGVAVVQTFYDNGQTMIWIFGDSFSASKSPESWVSLLDQPVNNFASNGSSEYRIYKNYYAERCNIGTSDTVLFVHTSPSRIFLKDNRSISSRHLESHTNCDIIINDVFEKKEKEFMQILESIWDDEYFDDIFDLIIDKLQTVPNSIHITFFETNRADVIQLHHVWAANSGNINHMNEDGNRLVANIVKQLTH
jgi:hypothetical protein